MSTSGTTVQYVIDMEANMLGSLTVNSADGATDTNMLALAKAFNDWKTANPTSIQINITKQETDFTMSSPDFTVNPAVFD